MPLKTIATPLPTAIGKHQVTIPSHHPNLLHMIDVDGLPYLLCLENVTNPLAGSTELTLFVVAPDGEFSPGESTVIPFGSAVVDGEIRSYFGTVPIPQQTIAGA